MSEEEVAGVRQLGCLTPRTDEETKSRQAGKGQKDRGRAGKRGLETSPDPQNC